MSHKKELLDDYLKKEILGLKIELRKEGYALPPYSEEKFKEMICFKTVLQNPNKPNILIEEQAEDSFVAKTNFVTKLQEVLTSIKNDRIFEPFRKQIQDAQPKTPFVPYY